MPTVNPRITITLQPSMHAVLQRMSGATGNSMSSIVCELLTEIQPILERMTLVIESAKTATVEAKSQVRAGMEAAQLDLEKHMHMTMDIFDQVMTDAVSTVEQSHVAKPTTGPRGTGRRTARAGSAAALPTPPVTRGSGTPVADPVKTRKRIAVAGRKPFGGANG